jgi:hypothetical protein
MRVLCTKMRELQRTRAKLENGIAVRGGGKAGSCGPLAGDT